MKINETFNNLILQIHKSLKLNLLNLIAIFTDRNVKQSVVLSSAILLGGCASFEQPQDKVLIREPGQQHYSAPASVSESAKHLWEYAALSTNVYKGNWPVAQKKELVTSPLAASPDSKVNSPYVEACVADPSSFLPLVGWSIWPDFPSQALKNDALARGLYLEVWERTTAPHTIVVVFNGTQFKSWPDWISNLRWLRQLIPADDQYTLVSKRLGMEFVDEILKRKDDLFGTNKTPVKIVTTGHSLGGGLAQNFAYSLPNSGIESLKVSHVYAFDPTPVTGWFSVDSILRAHNAAGLEIDRVFEHGEILAYIRLLQSYVFPPNAINPGIREIRYNFVHSSSMIGNHVMAKLACNLADVNLRSQLPTLK